MKRLIAVLLALSMAFYVAPVSALAASDDSLAQTITVNSQPDADLVQAIASDPFLTAQANSASQGQNATVDTSNVSMEATNSFGKLLLNGMDEENGSNFSSDNRITSIVLNGRTATVKYLVEEDADLVVGIYADDAEEQMVASGTVAVTKTTDGTATVTITGDIPEYYVIKGYLFDKAEHAPLCDPFIDTVSTKAHVDVENATVDDFPEDRVVNLDTDNKTNFVVVNNEVELVKNEGSLLGKNEVSSYDTSNEVYTISNASEEIRGLKAGQILVYEYEEGNLLIVRPEQVEVNGDTVTIYGDKNLELIDAFEMIKIDVSADTDDLIYEGEEYQESDDDSEFEDWNNIEETNVWQGEGHPKSNPIPLKVKATEKNGIAVSLTGKMTIDTDFAYYVTWDYQFVQMVTTTHITEGKLVVEAGNKPLDKDDVVQKELHGLKFPFPWGALKITPVIEVGVAGKGTINFESTVIKGTEYVHKGLLQFEKNELGKAPEFDIKSANVTGELSASVSFKTEACAIGMFDVYLVEVGLQLRFTWTGVFSPNILDSTGDTEDSIHLCKVCIKVTPKAKIEMGFVGKFLECEKLSFEIMWPIAETTGDEKYISVTYKDIGFGECPHRQYRVDITFDGNNGEGHQVYESNPYLSSEKTLLGTLDREGKLKAYLEPASGYKVSTTINGTEYQSDTFTVRHEPTSVTFGPGKKEPEPDKPEPDTPEGTVASGKCGDNLTWVLTSDGTLTISGTGTMYNYDSWRTTAPWKNYTVSKAIIKDGVTSIGDCAFFGNKNLGEVSISSSVLKIGQSAFRECSRLSVITIPEGVEVIDGWAFEYCYDLFEVNLPNSLMDLGTGAFQGCSSLAKIEIPKGITVLKKDVFQSCRSLNEVVIPENITEIGENTFFECRGVTKVKFSSTLKKIGDAAFANCTSLSEAKIPYGVTQIDRSAFNNCALTEAEIPDSVVTMGEYVFANCKYLTKIKLSASMEKIPNGLVNSCAIEEFVVPKWITSIGKYAFGGCKKLEKITIPDSVTSIGEGAFNYCTSLTEFTIPSGVTIVDRETFKGCSNLKNVVIPESIVKIDWEAFADCTALDNVVLPNGLTALPISAFSGCRSLKQISLPESLQKIGAYAFTSCKSLENIEIPNGVEQIDYQAFAGSGIKSITLPESVTYLGDGAFVNCQQLQTAKLSSALTQIGESTFSGCDNLEQISNFENITTIKKYAFKGCKGLLKMEIPENVQTIGMNAYEGCSILKTVIIPVSVTEIQKNAFKDCLSLKEINYTGTKAQWKAIEVAENEKLLSCTIHCTDGDILPESENSVTTGKTDTSGNTLHAVFNGLTAGEDYAVIVSKSSTNPFDANNLIYVNQKTAGTGGVLDVPFTSSESGAVYVVACRRGNETQVKTKYKVTLKDYGGTSDGDVSKEYEVGATVRATYKMDPLDGRTFKCWRVVEGDITIENPESKAITFTMPAHDVVIEVIYNPAKPSTKPSDSGSSSTTTKQDDGGGAIIAVVLIGGAAIAAVTAGVILMMPVEVSGVAQLGDGNVLANANVQLMKDGQQVAQTTTDESGRFALEVKRGEYQLNVITTNPETGEQIVRTTSIKAPAKNTSFVF